MSTWRIALSFTLPLTVLVLVPVLIHYSLEELEVRNTASLAVGSLLMLAGAILLAWTNMLFVGFAQGTLAPWDPPRKLVLMGPYQYVRNPMILGVLMILLGETLVFSSFYLLAWMLAFAILYDRWLEYREEPALRNRFGDDFRTYCEKVDRWIPRRTPFRYQH